MILGPFRLGGKAGTLPRGTVPGALGGRVVALLRALVEQWGVPVSKKTPIDAAGPGLAVEESNLVVQIAALRRLFGEEPGGEGWIETLRFLPCRGASLPRAMRSLEMLSRRGQPVRLRELEPQLRVSNIREVIAPYRRPAYVAKWEDGLRKAGLSE